MNRMLSILIGLFFVFATAGAAGAVSYLYTDTFAPDAEYMQRYWYSGEENSSISWTFDITRDGFEPLAQDIGSASVGLILEDDNGGDYFIELAGFEVGQESWWGEVDTRDYRFRLSVSSLATLSDHGVIDATLTAFWGDFDFRESTLYASSSQPVPEPATMLLFGSGLVCLAGVVRRRRNGRRKGSFSEARTAVGLTGVRTYQDSCSA